jgi:hypothetical protein
MGLQLVIPDSVVQAMRLPEKRLTQELLAELRLRCTPRGIVSLAPSSR